MSHHNKSAPKLSSIANPTFPTFFFRSQQLFVSCYLWSRLNDRHSYFLFVGTTLSPTTLYYTDCVLPSRVLFSVHIFLLIDFQRIDGVYVYLFMYFHTFPNLYRNLFSISSALCLYYNTTFSTYGHVNKYWCLEMHVSQYGRNDVILCVNNNDILD